VETNNLNSKTAEGLMEFCDYMVEKGYATPRAMEAWKVAARKVLQTVEGEDKWSATDLTALNMDDLLGRFQTLTLGQYKPDSVTTYGRRMQNAIDAYFEFVETGRPPQLRRQSNGGDSGEAKPKAKGRRTPRNDTGAGGELIEFPFPLKTGEMATLRLPRRIQRDDVDRLSGFLRTLQVEPQKALPEHTGEDADLADAA
jgi:hypothetical protein